MKEQNSQSRKFQFSVDFSIGGFLDEFRLVRSVDSNFKGDQLKAAPAVQLKRWVLKTKFVLLRFYWWQV